MDKTQGKCFAALYGDGDPPTDAEVAEHDAKKQEAISLADSEFRHQAKLHRWLTKNHVLHFHPPNELVREKTARAQNAIGMSSGVPDIVIPMARKPYHGLYIELKSQRYGVVSGSQQWWLESLVSQDYKACVSYGLEESQKIVTDYLGLPKWNKACGNCKT